MGGFVMCKFITEGVVKLADEYSIELGVELRQGSLEGVETRINNLRTQVQSNPINLRLNTTNVTRQIASIRRQIESLSNIRITLSDGNGGGTRSINNIQTATLAYRELISVIKEMGSVQAKIANLNGTNNNSQITTLTAQLDRLREKYTNLRSTFDQSFDVGQLVGIETELQKVANNVDLVNAKMADKSAVNSQREAITDINSQYKELISIQSQIGSTRIKLAGLNPETEAQQIEVLRNQLYSLKTAYDNIFSSSKSGLSIEQAQSLVSGFERIEHSVDLVNAKMADTTAINRQAEAYQRLANIAAQMNKLELQIGGLKNTGGSENQITVLTEQLETLRSEYQSLMTTMQGSLSNKQYGDLYNSFEE